ncbi:hypothetical protein [Megasphaera hutchinsoni]|uniref:hypothetical protein n=1 Tax=Megasphaera hutchinsoni TaxID=1588748 RepID=UPI0015E10C7F|nr:hypothetical protein [Megasphaera genomosp. type_2]
MEVWHVRSLGDKKAIHGTDMKVANVVAAGIQAKVGKEDKRENKYQNTCQVYMLGVL